MRRIRSTEPRLWPDAGNGTGSPGIAVVQKSAAGGSPFGRWPRPLAEDTYAVLERRRRRAQIAARHALYRDSAFSPDAGLGPSLVVRPGVFKASS